MVLRRVANGVRSSWEASAVKRFMASNEASSRPNMWFRVFASRPISSSLSASGSRWSRLVASISRALRVI